MPNLEARNLDYVLAGMTYPARYWQILAWADYNCATSKLRKALWQLPDKTYVNQRAIAAALWEQPGGAVACCPSPRTAVPAHRIVRKRYGRSYARPAIRRIA
jgi:hypothetical protein